MKYRKSDNLAIAAVLLFILAIIIGPKTQTFMTILGVLALAAILLTVLLKLFYFFGTFAGGHILVPAEYFQRLKPDGIFPVIYKWHYDFFHTHRHLTRRVDFERHRNRVLVTDDFRIKHPCTGIQGAAYKR